jgi:hypothetical protein
MIDLFSNRRSIRFYRSQPNVSRPYGRLTEAHAKRYHYSVLF